MNKKATTHKINKNKNKNKNQTDLVVNKVQNRKSHQHILNTKTFFWHSICKPTSETIKLVSSIT